MCGIAGAHKRSEVNHILKRLEHRGNNPRCKKSNGFVLGARTHSMVGSVNQPVSNNKAKVVFNGEIYNWERHVSENGDCENDTQLLLKQAQDKEFEEILSKIRGIYSMAIQKNNKIRLARDIIGVNPLYYTKNPFRFSSEKQSLEKFGNVKELNPRRTLTYDLEKQQISFGQRKFLGTPEEERTVKNVADRLVESVSIRIPDEKVALLFSGGLDSLVLAKIMKDLDVDFKCYVAGTQPGNTSKPRDIEAAKKAAHKMALDLEVVQEDGLNEIESRAEEIADAISTTNPLKLSVGLTMDLAMNGDERCVISGLGSEQIFGGYEREVSADPKRALQNLKRLYQRDLYRDNVISFLNNKELRLPFLDKDLIRTVLAVPKQKKAESGELSKKLLRDIAKNIGVPEELITRKKLAAQYGSNMTKALNKISDAGLEEYTHSIRERNNNSLVCLSSGGKDSVAAIYRMKKRNNRIQSVLTVSSENDHSYMFDTNNSLVKKQVSEMEADLITVSTDGVKEEELEDLKRGIRQEADENHVTGICSGAIQSNYQRTRLRKLADQTGLRCYSPLWGWDPESYMRWISKLDMEVKIVRTSAKGLNDSWEGRTLDSENTEKLIDLAREHGFHPAGEGGGYETEVVELPSLLKT